MTVSCCSWWWRDKTIKSVSDQSWWSSKTTRQRLSRITGGVSCFLFYFIQKKKWLKVTECLHLLCLRETRTVSTLSSRDINTFTKVNVSLWPRVSSTFTVQRNMAKIHRRFQNTLSRAPSDSVSVQDAGMMRGPQVQLCACDDVCVYICSCVCVCVCQSMLSWSRGSFSPVEVLDEATPPSCLFLCVGTEERGRYKAFRGRRQEVLNLK